jgi:hypothetical protein
MLDLVCDSIPRGTCTAIPRCHIFLALHNAMKTNILLETSTEEEKRLAVMEILDMAGFSAILAVGCEEC